MSQQLISLSPDLQRLRDEGLDLEIKSGYLLVKDVPFVNSRKEVSFGTLVSELTFGAGNITAKPRTHVCLLYTSPSPRDLSTSRMPSSA